MDDHLEELERAEEAVRGHLAGLLVDFATPYAAIDRVLRAYAEQFASRSDPVATVQKVLLARVADDLRTLWILAVRGYGLQANALASVVLETGFTAGYICHSNDRALTWLNWQDPLRTPWSIKDLLSGALAGDAADLQKGFRIWYAGFCWGKHANPVIQKNAPISLSPAGHVVNSFPQVSPSHVWRLAVALYGALQVAVLALRPLIEGDPHHDVTGAIWADYGAVAAGLGPLGRRLFQSSKGGDGGEI